MDNQTEDLWFVGGTPVDKGTGIYVYPSADANTFGTSDFRLHAESRFFGPIEKALVKDLKYLDCVARGMKAPVVAFKWVPSDSQASKAFTPRPCAARNIVFADAQGTGASVLLESVSDALDTADRGAWGGPLVLGRRRRARLLCVRDCAA